MRLFLRFVPWYPGALGRAGLLVGSGFLSLCRGLGGGCGCERAGGLYCGGSAQMVERALGFEGDETLYVGDHIYTDVSQSKLHLRWRTCLICRELEREVGPARSATAWPTQGLQAACGAGA